MDYLQKLKYHYRPSKGWVNDPNGLVYFQGYYHVFYQHAPDYETPWKQPMHWGHARTKDFLKWEELPVALFPDKKRGNILENIPVHWDRLPILWKVCNGISVFVNSPSV